MLVPLLACQVDTTVDGTDSRGTKDPTDSAPVDSEPVDSEPIDTGDTGDTGAEPDTDTAPPDDSDTQALVCAEPEVTTSLVPGGTTSSAYATHLVADIDGGGVADLLYEAWLPDRSVAWLPGEAVQLGAYDPRVAFAASMETSQSTFAAGVTGDLDGDGIAEVVLGEGGTGDEAALVVWSPGSSGAPLSDFDLDGAGYVMPTVEPGPDLDADGLAELVYVLTSGVERLLVTPGATVATGGTHGQDDASLVVTPATAIGYPASGTDLDGDGIAEVLFIDEAIDGSHLSDTLRAVPADVAAAGGQLTSVDLPALVNFEATTAPPLVYDVDGDGLVEVYGLWYSGTMPSSLLGWRGVDVEVALTTGTPLTPDDAWLRVDGVASEYLGRNVAIYSDEACEPALAISAHLYDTVFLVPGETLRPGGVLDLGTLASVRGAPDYGYVLSGGQDLDGDGALDLVIGDSGGSALDLFLGP